MESAEVPEAISNLSVPAEERERPSNKAVPDKPAYCRKSRRDNGLEELFIKFCSWKQSVNEISTNILHQKQAG